MFNKELFLSLCKKYNVELSNTAASPMIKVGTDTHEITESDVKFAFELPQAYFDYLDNSLATKIKNPTYYLCEDYGIAC